MSEEVMNVYKHLQKLDDLTPEEIYAKYTQLWMLRESKTRQAQSFMEEIENGLPNIPEQFKTRTDMIVKKWKAGAAFAMKEARDISQHMEDVISMAMIKETWESKEDFLTKWEIEWVSKKEENLSVHSCINISHQHIHPY